MRITPLRAQADLSTFVLIDSSGFSTESTAVLRIAGALDAPVLRAAATAGMAVPKPLRNSVYRIVAGNRYSLLGKDESGDAPSCTLRDDIDVVRGRFLELPDAVGSWEWGRGATALSGRRPGVS